MTRVFYHWPRRNGKRDLLTYQAVKEALDRHQQFVSLKELQRNQRARRIRDLTIAGVWLLGALAVIAVVGFLLF